MPCKIRLKESIVFGSKYDFDQELIVPNSTYYSWRDNNFKIELIEEYPEAKYKDECDLYLFLRKKGVQRIEKKMIAGYGNVAKPELAFIINVNGRKQEYNRISIKQLLLHDRKTALEEWKRNIERINIKWCLSLRESKAFERDEIISYANNPTLGEDNYVEYIELQKERITVIEYFILLSESLYITT